MLLLNQVLSLSILFAISVIWSPLSAYAAQHSPVAVEANKNTVHGTSGSTTLTCVPNGPYIEFDITMTPAAGKVISFTGTLTINTLVLTIIGFEGTNYGPTPSGLDSIQRNLADFPSGSYIAIAAGGGTTTSGEFVIGGAPTGLPFCTFEVP